MSLPRRECVYIYVYITLLSPSLPLSLSRQSSAAPHFSLYKILFYSLQNFIVGVYHPSFDCSRSICNAYPIAILLHAHCAIYFPPPTIPLYATHHTKLIYRQSPVKAKPHCAGLD